jgi:hypothetical protein
VWTAQLTYTAPGLDLERRLEIVDALAANAVYDDDTGRLTLTFEVDAATSRQAAETALRTAGAAGGSAAHGVTLGRPTRMLVMPTEEFIAEAEHPGALDLSGVAEIAERLGVSRQRVGQLIEREDFPTPVSRLAAGPIFTTASVDAFKTRWEPGRKPGRPWPKSTGTDAEHDGAPRRRAPRNTTAPH